MSTNCLVTKLKGVIDNENLPKLNTLKLKVIQKTLGDAYQQQVLTIGPKTETMHLLATGNGYFGYNFNTLDTSHVSEDTKTGRISLFVKNDNYYLEVNNKYDLAYLELGNTPASLMSIDTNDIKNCTQLEEVSLRSAQTIGNLSDFSLMKNLRRLSLNGSQITGNTSDIGSLINLTLFRINGLGGNISVLSNITGLSICDINDSPNLEGELSSIYNLINLTEFRVRNSKISGSLQDLGAAQVSAGRTSGSLLITCNGIITLDGTTIIANQTNKTITFDSSISGGYSIS